MHLPESLQDLADSEAVRFLRRPKSISRICGGVFSLVIFSSLLTDGYQNKTESSQLSCVLNSNHMACSFAVGAGFLSFLSCLIFLALDAQESRIIGIRFKTAFQLLDFILSVLWAGVWFVAFCFLASQWQHSKSKHFLLGNSSAKAAIAFAFFSIPVWDEDCPTSALQEPLWYLGLESHLTVSTSREESDSPSLFHRKSQGIKEGSKKYQDMLVTTRTPVLHLSCTRGR